MTASAESQAASVRPAPGTPRPYRFPHFETRTLPNGMRIEVFDNEAEAIARAEQLTTEPGPNGEAPLTPQEVLFFKWLGRVFVAILKLLHGIPIP